MASFLRQSSVSLIRHLRFYSMSYSTQSRFDWEVCTGVLSQSPKIRLLKVSNDVAAEERCNNPTFHTHFWSHRGASYTAFFRAQLEMAYHGQRQKKKKITAIRRTFQTQCHFYQVLSLMMNAIG